MASFRKRSRKYKRKNTRRNTRRKYIKARKSRVSRRSRKSLVGGVWGLPSRLFSSPTKPPTTPALSSDPIPPTTTSALSPDEQPKLKEAKEEIEKTIIEMAYINWKFNHDNDHLLRHSINIFYETDVLKQRQFYRTNFEKYVDLLKNSGYMEASDIFNNLKNFKIEEDKFIKETDRMFDKHEWSLNRIQSEKTTPEMIRKLDIINNRSEQLVNLLNTHYNNIIKLLKEDVARLKLQHSIDIDIDALISEEKLKDMYETYMRGQVIEDW
jgi:hypothetical protein